MLPFPEAGEDNTFARLQRETPILRSGDVRHFVLLTIALSHCISSVVHTQPYKKLASSSESCQHVCCARQRPFPVLPTSEYRVYCKTKSPSGVSLADIGKPNLQDESDTKDKDHDTVDKETEGWPLSSNLRGTLNKIKYTYRTLPLPVPVYTLSSCTFPKLSVSCEQAWTP